MRIDSPSAWRGQDGALFVQVEHAGSTADSGPGPAPRERSSELFCGRGCTGTRTLCCVSLPDEVRSVGELRDHLAQAMTDVRRPGAAPVFVGRHRRREAVLLSAERYEQLLTEERRAAAADALGSVRAEGLEPSPYGLDTLQQLVEGAVSVEDATAGLVAHYRQ